MALAGILAELDAEIGKLKQARSLLTDGTQRGPGRPKAAGTVGKATKPMKRNISPEGRARIVEAVKARWAAQKKAGKA